jgi:MoaA/NifB/PqqE/SkfB family radical SAM enzyme
MPSFTAPVRVSLDLTYACDLRCVHCRTNTGEIPAAILRQMLDVDQLRGVLRELDAMRVLEITLTGGEPTIHPRFFHLLETIRELRYASVTLITNANLLTPEKIDRIVDAGVESIRVSIDGTRETFAAIRLEDAYERVIENARYIRARVPNFKLLTTVMTLNIDNIFTLVDELRGHGFRRLDLILVRAHGRGGRNNLLLSEPQAAELQRQVADFQARVSEHDFELALNAPYLAPEQPGRMVHDVVMYPYIVKNASLAISATGDVTMSRLYSPLPIGNVKHDTIAQLWARNQDQLQEEASNFDDARLRDVFWKFGKSSAQVDVELSSLLDRQLFRGEPVR